MSAGTIISALINIAVAIYFIALYPRFMQRQFRGRTPPPLFRLLGKGLPILGYLLIVLTLYWLATDLGGSPATQPEVLG